MLVKYTGKKTAFYNGRSYYPGEVFEIPDTVLDRATNKEVPLVLKPTSALKAATLEEFKSCWEGAPTPRAARRASMELSLHKAATETKRKTAEKIAADKVNADNAAKVAESDAKKPNTKG